MEDERSWSQKLFKLYRTLRKLETRKYNGGHFAPEIKQMTSYFAVKHMLYPAGVDEDASIFSDNASSAGRVLQSCSPRKFVQNDVSPPNRLSVNSR